MAARKSLVHPVLFSSHFGVPATALAGAKWLDPILNSDTKLFIDPLLLWKSQNPRMISEGRTAVETSFQDVIGLLDISEAEGDVAWKGAYKALDLDERAETSLGYGALARAGVHAHRSCETAFCARPSRSLHSVKRTPL